MENIINPTHLGNTRSIAEAFQSAHPFRHVLLENFLDERFLDDIRAEFPKPPPPAELKNEFGARSLKHAVQDIRDLGETFRAWDRLLSSERFIKWLCEMTGIEGLLYDPEYHGAGTHNNLHGQSMNVHIDFNYHRTTGYHRRLNLIVYISEEWEESWGGSLELHKNPWLPDSDEWVSYPSFGNNAVLFETNEISWHGFGEVTLPEGKRHLSRKSLTVYYYSKERPQKEIGGKHATIYVPWPMSNAVQPDQVLTQAEYLGLKRNFHNRNVYLKALYDREATLMETIDSYKHMLDMYAGAFQLPLLGYVRQVGRASGVLPNLTVNEDISVELESVKPIRSIVLEGFVPKFVNEGRNTLHLSINGVTAKTVKVEDSFKVTLPFERDAGNKFRLSITAEQKVSPKEMGLNADETLFRFVFGRLTFE